MDDLQCAEAGWDVCRDIYISNSKKYHVGKCVECAESAGPILDDFDDAIEPFGHRIGEPGSDEGQYAIEVSFDGVDELTHRFQSASEGGCQPLPDEAFSSPRGLVLPELLKLILELPGSVNTAIGLVECPQRFCVFPGAS